MKKLLVFAVIFISCIELQAYTGMKAILLVNRNLQKDTIGYNIADDMARVCYQAIQNGSIKLWESPEKNTVVDFSKLQEQESNNHSKFIHPRNIFIYEEWSLEKNKYRFITKGISFTGTDSSGKDIFFGYIAMNDAVNKLFDSSYANVNADGYYGTTLLQELQSRHFEFDIVFFKNKPVRNFKKGQKLIKEVLSAKNSTYKNQSPDTKLVEYSIEAGPSILSDASGKLITTLQNFFNENPQEFFNLGGDKMYSFMRESHVILSNILVSEIWTKTKDSITGTPVDFIPYVVGNPLQGISVQQLNEWHVKYNGADFAGEIAKKNFYYRITKINSTWIPGENSEKLKSKLLKGDWHGLNADNNYTVHTTN